MDATYNENAARVKSKRALQRRTNLTAFLFILPNLLGFVLLTLIPIVASFGIAFMHWTGSPKHTFVGFENFAKLFTDSNFLLSLVNTVYYSVFVIPLTMVFALALALVLNRKFKLRNTLRAIYFFPYVASLIAVTAVWSMLFEPSMGPVNTFLTKVIGMETPPGWLTDVDWAMPVVIIVSVWRGMGYNMVLFLAGLQNVPTELYEAAELDGANARQKFTHVTWPLLAPTTFFVLIMLTINSFKVFDMIAVMTAGGPGRATQVLVYYIYNVAFVNTNFGYASAVALVLFFIVLAITFFQMRMERKWVNY